MRAAWTKLFQLAKVTMNSMHGGISIRKVLSAPSRNPAEAASHHVGNSQLFAHGGAEAASVGWTAWLMEQWKTWSNAP